MKENPRLTTRVVNQSCPIIGNIKFRKVDELESEDGTEIIYACSRASGHKEVMFRFLVGEVIEHVQIVTLFKWSNVNGWLSIYSKGTDDVPTGQVDDVICSLMHRVKLFLEAHSNA